ncbi:MAG: glutathione S-transferase N-terminal domain-containing protein [Parvularculaceae bacterium]
MAETPIDLYYWPTPNGWKITIALEEMALRYRVRFVDILHGDQFAPEFLQVSPNNRIPAIVDCEGSEGTSVSIFESGAILTYLGRKSGKFYPQDERGRARVEQWLMWQVGGFGPMLGQAHHFRLYAQEKIPYAIERYTNEAHRLYGVLDRGLAGKDYIAGDYSIADMAIYPWAVLHDNQGVDLEEYPEVRKWLERIGARPAVKRGMAVGSEKRSAALAENSEEGKEARAVLFGQRARKS